MLDEKIIKKGGRSIKRIKWDIEKAKAYFAGHGLDVIDNKFVNVRTPLTTNATNTKRFYHPISYERSELIKH